MDTAPGRIPNVLPGVNVRYAQSRLKFLRLKLPLSVSFVEIGSFGLPDAPRMVAESDPDAEAGPDALAVPRPDGRLVLRRLVIEALVPGADVAEDRRPREPVGQRRGLLHLRGGGLRLLGVLLDLLLRRLSDRPLLVDLLAELLDLVLRVTELLLEHAKTLLHRRLGAPGRRDRQKECRRQADPRPLPHRDPPGSSCAMRRIPSRKMHRKSRIRRSDTSRSRSLLGLVTVP
jgi:hypothetical protein